MMVTSNDSRIRFANIATGVVLLKIKGHKNEKCMIRGSMSADGKQLICASDDGTVYLWSQIKQKVMDLSKKGVFGKLLTSKSVQESEHF